MDYKGPFFKVNIVSALSGLYALSGLKYGVLNGAAFLRSTLSESSGETDRKRMLLCRQIINKSLRWPNTFLRNTVKLSGTISGFKLNLRHGKYEGEAQVTAGSQLHKTFHP